MLAACDKTESEAPQSLAGSGADGEVTLDWDEVDGAQSYNIYWNSTGKDNDTDESQSADGPPYVITGLSNDSTYYFRVTAVSSEGESPASQSIVARPSAARLLSIELSPDSQSMVVGTRQYFTATGVYSDGTTQDVSRLARWISSNTAIATVLNKGRGGGLVEALQPGIAQIRATYRGVSARTEVLPTYAQLREITLLPHDPQIARGTKLAFKAIGNFGYIIQDITASVSWGISNPSVASVGATIGREGLAHALSVGDSEIIASFDGVMAQSQLRVTHESLQSITLSPVNPTIALGLTQAFTATGEYSDGSRKDITQNILWESSEPNVATVANYSSGAYDPAPAGLTQTAWGHEGVTTITARLQNISASTTLTVTEPQILALRLTPAISTLAPNQSIPLATALEYTDGSSSINPVGVEFTSSDTSVATVDSNGVITGLAAGSATITATYFETPDLLAAMEVHIIALSIDHNTITTGCADCHDGSAAAPKPATHPITSDFCESCHYNSAWLPLIVPLSHEHTADRCINCHDGNVVIGKNLTHPATTAACDVCHSIIGWLPVLVPFDHSQSLTSSCNDCHGGPNAPNKPATHPNTSNACESCHYVFGWQPLVFPFDHSQAHITNCATTGCHTENDKPAFHPDTADDCVLCHNANSWLPAGSSPVVTLPGNLPAG